MATIANQNNKDESTVEEQQQKPASATSAFIGNNASANPSAQQGGAPQPASSGKFTNIQSYLNANKQAGQQIGGRIQKGVNTQLNKEVAGANKEAQDVRAGIDAANKNIQQGATFLGNVGGNTAAYNPQQPITKLNDNQMMDLVANQEQFDKFTGQRTGATAQADQATLDKENQEAAARAQQANQALIDRQSQLGTESGRYGLLGEMVGQKNNYSKGAQRLDQVFLQRDPNKTLNSLNQNLQQQKDTTFKGLTDTTKSLADASTKTIDTAKNLSTDLQNQTTQNQNQYIDDLTKYVDVVNKARADEQARWQNSFDILTGKAQGTIDNSFWDAMGLQEGIQALNTMKNIGSLGDIATQGRTATGYQDVANQQDIDRYAALAKLAGGSNAALTQAGNLDAAIRANMTQDGNTVLLDRLNQGIDSFRDAARAKDFGGVWNYADAWGDDYTTQFADKVNMADILGINSLQPNDGKVRITGANPGGLSDVVEGGKDALQTGAQDYGKSLVNSVTGKGTLTDALNLGTFGSSAAVTDLLRGISGNNKRSEREAGALQNAYNVRNNNIQNWINDQGVYNTLTRSGVQDSRNMVSTGPAVEEGSSEPMSFDQVRELLRTRGQV